MFQPLAQKRFLEEPETFTETFKHQFLICRDRGLELPGWVAHQAGGWHVYHAPDLPCVPLQDIEGRHLGWLLGIAVDADGRAVKGQRTLDLNYAAADFTSKFEDFIEGCAGRYVVVLMTDEMHRVYLDPVGDLGVVYDPDNARAGSTNAIVQDRDFIDNPVIPYGRVRIGDGSYTMGHTRDARIKRLLGNHYLDLAKMQAIRHWPKSDTDLETRRDKNDVLDINDAITARLSQIFTELLRTEKVILPLSGGRDSRCLLGCGMSEIQRTEFIFTVLFNRASRSDSERAKLICERLKLSHREFSFVRLTRPLKMQFLLRNGYADFGNILKSLAIFESLPGGNVMVRGNVMEILRATNWQRQREGVLNLPHALKRLRSGFSAEEQMEKFGDDFMCYYEAMPANAQSKVYDMEFAEVLLTHGQGARYYGLVQNFFMNAFNDRKLLALSMQLPVQYRMSEAAYDRIVATTLPQLGDMPYV